MQVFRHINQKYSPSFLTIGNYDGIHLGHQAILKKLKSESKSNNILSSVMTFEPHPREFFSPKLHKRLPALAAAVLAVAVHLPLPHPNQPRRWCSVVPSPRRIRRAPSAGPGL